MSRNILQGLIGAWCPTLGPSGYTLLDRSGRGQHGTLTNMDAGTDWVGSPGGWALDYDGTNDYSDFGANIALGGLQQLTIATWVWRATAGQFFTFTRYDNSQGAEATADYFGTNNITANGQVAFLAATKGNTNNYVLFHSTETMTAGAWNFIAASVLINGASSTGQLFLNGALCTFNDASSATKPTAWPANNATTYKTARIVGSSGASVYSSGRVGDMMAWNRRLAAAEIRGLYQLGQSGLGRLLTPQRRSYAFRVPAAVKSYLFTNRGQVIGGGTL
jgi:hypothetical protein